MKSPLEVKKLKARKSKKNVLFMDPSIYTKAKNLDGTSGAKCDYCAGYGFTMGLKGSRITCRKCDGTGVKQVSVNELQAQITKLQTVVQAVVKDQEELRKALLAALDFHETRVEKRSEEKLRNGLTSSQVHNG